MYSSHRLETPPPTSRFRRPWSPEPFDPNPRLSFDDITRSIRQEPPQQSRREGSDYSVEALDLAEYAHTLAGRGNVHAQPQPAFQPYAAYPPSPQPFRPLSSRTSTSTPPLFSPSLSTSLGTHSESSRSSAPRRATHRPFSFPPPTLTSDSSRRHHSPSSRRTAAQDHDVLRTPPPEPDDEIDIAQFPAFTRGWYRQSKAGNDPLSQYTPFQVDPFDPSFPTHEFGGYSTPPPLYNSLNSSSHASQSSRNAVPWGTDAQDAQHLDAQVKEERIRMLEREFAKTSAQGDEEERLVGSVDSKGRLITEGPKKRTLTRWLQVLLALMAAGSSIYAAAMIKTPSPPPPANKPPAYVLYVLSVLTFLVSLYLFILYPACCGPRRRRKAAGTQFTGGPAGMMVLPVQGLSGGNKKKDKKNAKGGEGVQVNLIVDPGMFNGGLDEDDADEETSESEHTIPGTYSDRSRQSRRKRRAAKRRSIFAGLALEEQWKHARKMLKWGMAVDVLMFFAWGAEFVYILIGKRCRSGSFDGWCDAYNVASAAACMLCFAFGLSIFFDIKDLHASSTSPRTRSRV